MIKSGELLDSVSGSLTVGIYFIAFMFFCAVVAILLGSRGFSRQLYWRRLYLFTPSSH